jgi:hypothetical protein
MHSQQQVGDYVIERLDPNDFWNVRMAGAEDCISSHSTEKEAMAALKRYQAGDKRRQKKEQPWWEHSV